MDVVSVVERVREMSLTSGDPGAARAAIEAAITAAAQVKSWLAAADARLARLLAAQVSFPEKAIADCTRSSLNDAAKTKERADTLDKVPGFADALDAAAVTSAHIDPITRGGKPLTGQQRCEYFERVAGLVAVANVARWRFHHCATSELRNPSASKPCGRSPATAGGSSPLTMQGSRTA